MTRPNTRTRILVSSLVLFNEHGEPNTTTNDIADETDISPGNLHYHFRRKSDIVEALLAEFQADARLALQAPSGDESAIDEFWGFLQLLIELLAAYRFLIRDTETLVDAYPKVNRAVKGFITGLLGAFELHIHGMQQNGMLHIDDTDVPDLGRSLALVAIFSERLDTMSGGETDIEHAASRIAETTIRMLLPYTEPDAAGPLQALLERYRR